MRLGLKPKMREKNSTRVQIPYELSHVPSHFSRHEHSFGNLTALMHPTDNLRYESHRIIESLGNLLHACMNSSFCMPVLHSDCSHAWNSHSDHSECAGQLLYRDFRGFVTLLGSTPSNAPVRQGGLPAPLKPAHSTYAARWEWARASGVARTRSACGVLARTQRAQSPYKCMTYKYIQMQLLGTGIQLYGYKLPVI